VRSGAWRQPSTHDRAGNQTGQADSDPTGRSNSDAASIGGRRPRPRPPDRHVGTPGQGTRWHQTAYVSPEREPHCSPHSRPSCCHRPGRWAWPVTQRRSLRTSGHPSPASARTGVELRDPLQQLPVEHLAVGRVLPAAQLRDRQRLAVAGVAVPAACTLLCGRCGRWAAWRSGPNRRVALVVTPSGGRAPVPKLGRCVMRQDVVWSSVQSRASTAVGCHTLTV